jgi:hypothetical protein
MCNLRSFDDPKVGPDKSNSGRRSDQNEKNVNKDKSNPQSANKNE